MKEHKPRFKYEIIYSGLVEPAFFGTQVPSQSFCPLEAEDGKVHILGHYVQSFAVWLRRGWLVRRVDSFQSLIIQMHLTVALRLCPDPSTPPAPAPAPALLR